MKLRQCGCDGFYIAAIRFSNNVYIYMNISLKKQHWTKCFQCSKKQQNVYLGIYLSWILLWFLLCWTKGLKTDRCNDSRSNGVINTSRGPDTWTTAVVFDVLSVKVITEPASSVSNNTDVNLGGFHLLEWRIVHFITLHSRCSHVNLTFIN